MAIVNWSTYLQFARSFGFLDEQQGALHQGAALLTWVASVDGDGIPTYQYELDHPDTYSVTPTSIQALVDTDNAYVRDIATQTRRPSELVRFAKTGGVWGVFPVTERNWVAGDLAIVVVVASEDALDDMVSVSNRKHLPLMRVYCDVNQGDTAYPPANVFTATEVGIISTWFQSLGANGNPKYPSGLLPATVAGFFGQYVPAVTNAATMSTWMQSNPRSDTIGVFGQVFEFAP